jgi:hypothetical protein
MLGAFKAKANDFGPSAPLSEFSTIEDRVPTSATKLARGVFAVAPLGQLTPGEYAVVLRPVSLPKKIALHEFETELGEGIMLRPAWDFTIQPNQKAADSAAALHPNG